MLLPKHRMTLAETHCAGIAARFADDAARERVRHVGLAQGLSGVQTPQAKMVAAVIAHRLELGGRALIAVAVRDRVRRLHRLVGIKAVCDLATAC
jgi:hypothetical protein